MNWSRATLGTDHAGGPWSALDHPAVAIDDRPAPAGVSIVARHARIEAGRCEGPSRTMRRVVAARETLTAIRGSRLRRAARRDIRPCRTPSSSPASAARVGCTGGDSPRRRSRPGRASARSIVGLVLAIELLHQQRPAARPLSSKALSACSRSACWAALSWTLAEQHDRVASAARRRAGPGRPAWGGVGARPPASGGDEGRSAAAAFASCAQCAAKRRLAASSRRKKHPAAIFPILE